ncbi:hypothetical protein [Paenibacillus sp. Soil787]|uniref:hypothetical protein n=1 Tax=Paenibacillus sp. Soil787 TaxID=1736411 RepID=UPI0006F4775E|nr:hypothetical protein [Paenibacillus sp. Soil787]KRF33984.1 hypothetical protein ASG93_26670 [Paenibacillus sp. Soil787]
MDNDLKEALTALLKAELSPVFERLDRIDGRLDGIDNRLDRLELEQAQIKQAVLETNETVKRIEVIQEQQHRIIELLSARSIEHEAKIKQIL